jgi:urease accessory protein UreF
MTKLTTFKEAAELVQHDPGNPDYAKLMRAVVDMTNEQSELEHKALKLGDALMEVIEQMNKLKAAQAAQRDTEIETGLGR